MKKVFLSADIEGTCGIAHWDETLPDKQMCIRDRGHVKLIGQVPHRFGKAQPLHLHDEGNHRAPGLATETVIELLLGVHGEGSCLFAVKRAQSPILVPVPLQCYIAGYHLHDIRPGTKLVQPGRWKARCHGCFTCPILSPRSENFLLFSSRRKFQKSRLYPYARGKAPGINSDWYCRTA